MADKNYSILKIEKLNRKKTQDIKMRCEHVNRKDYAENVNGELSQYNRCVVGEVDADWFKLFKDRFKELDYYKQSDSRKLRSDAVIGLEVVVSMSHDFVPNVDIDEWCEANTEWMKEHFGEKNVLHGVLHYLDEATPHIHYFITPVDEEGKFDAKNIMGGRQEYSERQTEYAKAMEKFGLRRGMKNSRLQYLEVKELYTATAKDVLSAPEIFEAETAAEYRERINGEFRALQLKINKLEMERNNLNITREHAHHLQAEIERLQALVVMLQEKLNSMEIEGISLADIMTALEYRHDMDDEGRQVIESYLDGFKQLAEFGREVRESKEKEANANKDKDVDDISEQE